MTAQIQDCYKHRRKEYSLVAKQGQICFKPEEYGLKPMAVCTACWRGYWCEYNVNSKGLFLKNLYIFTDDNKYPPINGVNVSEIEYDDCIQCTIGEDGEWIRKKAKTEKHMGHREYKNLNIPIKYTGKLLLGNDFLREYYIHMGFQQGWAYRELLEFEFKEGKLVQKNDYSEAAEKMRKKLDESGIDPSHPEGDDIPLFVENSFSQDYGIKAWWLKEEYQEE